MGRLRAAPGEPLVQPFMDALDTINGIAERSDGFIWRLKSDEGNATSIAVEGDPRLIPNISVWRDVQSLEHFVWNTLHRAFYKRRAEWFEVLERMYFVMWWVPEGHQPSLDEALARLAHLEEHGQTDDAFGWSYLEDAGMWRTHACAQVAAE
ncbi:DUF3291 domain-containing protein [Pontivivens ytuae]|uniref:DUF3291 domain-containing protein n=2 Tax=Pontivivens ytuae TaxID=2789856 RepID=A0A7S9LWI9_9RHOB|nr:DUF3291 domain-containing protein [Pontivivens ytuae]